MSFRRRLRLSERARAVIPGRQPALVIIVGFAPAAVILRSRSARRISSQQHQARPFASLRVTSRCAIIRPNPQGGADLFISVMTRRTAVADKAQWQERLKRALPRVTAAMGRYAGFSGVEYLWAASNDGAMAEVTRWSSRANYEAYLKGGGAATAATTLDAFLPTAAYPNGNWLRQSYEQVT